MTGDTGTLRAIVETLSALPQVEALSLSGSRAGGMGDDASDYDINVFSTGPIPQEIRRDLALRFDPNPEIANQWWGESDYWTDGAASYDLVFWDATGYERDPSLHYSPSTRSANANIRSASQTRSPSTVAEPLPRPAVPRRRVSSTSIRSTSPGMTCRRNRTPSMPAARPPPPRWPPSRAAAR